MHVAKIADEFAFAQRGQFVNDDHEFQHDTKWH